MPVFFSAVDGSLFLGQCPGDIKIKSVYGAGMDTLSNFCREWTCDERIFCSSDIALVERVNSEIRLDITAWIIEWNPHKSSLAMAVITSYINTYV